MSLSFSSLLCHKRETDAIIVSHVERIAKVTPERIYSLVVHPDPTKDLVSLSHLSSSTLAPHLISPSSIRSQVFAGDKYGHIALWDATHAGEVASTSNGSIRASKKEGDGDEDDGEAAGEDEVDEEPSKGKFWLWQAHNKSSVSSLKFRPNNTKKVSYLLLSSRRTR